MSKNSNHANTDRYDGPAGVVLTPDEVLIVWQLLTLNPRAETAELRLRCQRYLVSRDDVDLR